MRSHKDARKQALAGLAVEDRRLEVAGLETALLDGGRGAPFVLLHGPGESALHWMRVIPALVQKHRVVAPDLPAHGASGPLPKGGAAMTLEWLRELIEGTCDVPPTLVGTTMGGAIAARFAAEHGDRVNSLVLVDSLGLTPFSPEPEFGMALDAFLARPDSKTHHDLWRVCAYDVDRVRTGMGEHWEWMLGYTLDRIATPETMAGLGALMQEFALEAIPSDVLERIATPTTLVWGRYDLATSLATAEAASARYGWRLHVIEDCADAPALEQPEAFLDALESTISSPLEVTR